MRSVHRSERLGGWLIGADLRSDVAVPVIGGAKNPPTLKLGRFEIKLKVYNGVLAIVVRCLALTPTAVVSSVPCSLG